MGELIAQYGGTLEHFEGDGMMVFFNDPIELPDHEVSAVRMAIAMRDRFTEIESGWKKKGYDLGLGFGAAVGYATLGRIGYEGRYDYAAIAAPGCTCGSSPRTSHSSSSWTASARSKTSSSSICSEPGYSRLTASRGSARPCPPTGSSARNGRACTSGSASGVRCAIR